MQQIISNPPARLHEREISPNLSTRLPINFLILLVSIPAALLTAIVMGFLHLIRFITKSH